MVLYNNAGYCKRQILSTQMVIHTDFTNFRDQEMTMADGLLNRWRSSRRWRKCLHGLPGGTIRGNELANHGGGVLGLAFDVEVERKVR